MGLGYTDAEAWLRSNFALATALMLPGTAILIPITYLYGRWRAPEWEDWTTTLIGAAMKVACIYFFGSFVAIFLVAVIAALKAYA